MRLWMILSDGCLKRRDKEEMARLVNYIYQQYDLAKRELEKIRESQKKAKKATDEKD